MPFAIVCGLFISGCDRDEVKVSQFCSHRDSEHYDRGLSDYLTKSGIPNTTHPERGVCVPSERRGDFEKAATRLDNYYYEVAALMRDSCEERALVDWAKQQNLRYDVRDTTNSDGKPAERMFHLRSFSAEEVESNRQKLREEAPKNVRCGK
ncbi:MAG: hypothetical protein AB7P08_04710 [Burkholderiales bacterium]